MCVHCPVVAGGFLEAEKGARLLADSSLAAQVVSCVLYPLLDGTTWNLEEEQGTLSPENPEPLAARVSISNSRKVWLGSDDDPCASLVT